ncbi:hypothetical protein [Oricola thermophila]|uniref:Uncharacterized protein n=1 Tax=Oricola thermophila TaxID=2742145 RepID=A0A6N1VCW4_9HYPH|nr:hypothetical protein [Oricola thermophila]QKV18750.1 hypothetical protein HTY61_09955 [Oricola thermophila]
MTIITCPDCDEAFSMDELVTYPDTADLVRLHEAIVAGDRREASDTLRRMFPGELMDFEATERLLAARKAEAKPDTSTERTAP